MSTTCKSYAVIIMHRTPKKISSAAKQSLRIVARASILCASVRRLRAWEKTKNEWGTDATDRFPAKWRPRNDRRNSVLTTHHYSDLGSASDWLKICLTNQKHYPDLSSDASSVWNFCARFSDIIWRANLRFSQAKGKRAHMPRNGRSRP